VIDSGARAAQSGIDTSAKAVRKAVQAARRAASSGLNDGHSRAADVLDTVHDRADTMLGVVESAALGAIGAAAGRARDGTRKVHRRASALEASFAPARRSSLASAPITTALVGLGAGILLTTLLAPR